MAPFPRDDIFFEDPTTTHAATRIFGNHVQNRRASSPQRVNARVELQERKKPTPNTAGTHGDAAAAVQNSTLYDVQRTIQVDRHETQSATPETCSTPTSKRSNQVLVYRSQRKQKPGHHPWRPRHAAQLAEGGSPKSTGRDDTRLLMSFKSRKERSAGTGRVPQPTLFPAHCLYVRASVKPRTAFTD